MLKFEETDKQIVRIKVIGVGGGGSNAVDHMVGAGVDGVEFAVINTDAQVLSKAKAPEKIQIGKKVTRGLGTGGNPELGRQAVIEDRVLIKEALDGVDIVFITAGFGGGTGTGASPTIAEVGREIGALTVGVITKPFTFEGKKRMNQAENGMREFCDKVDTIICVPNDKIFDMIDQETPMHEAYRITDQILYQAVESISKVITQPGLINLDFADIRTILSVKGGAVIGFGEGSGKDKAVKAVQSALASPLLETRDIRGAKGILISIIGGTDLSLYEVHNAIGSIHEIADEDANIIIGAIIQSELKDKAMVTLIATGLDVDIKGNSIKRDMVLPLKEISWGAPSSLREFVPPPPPSFDDMVPSFDSFGDVDNDIVDEPVEESFNMPESRENEITRERFYEAPQERFREQEPEREPVNYQETGFIREETVPKQRDKQVVYDHDNNQRFSVEFDDRINDEDDEIEDEQAMLQARPVVNHQAQSASDFRPPQSEFFEKTDPTVYHGSNLDIPSFLRKKRTYSPNPPKSDNNTNQLF